MKTVLETIQAGSGFLEKRGVEKPRLNMEYLLADVLGCRRLDLYMEFDRPLDEDVLEPLRDLVKRRGTGIPLQHLTGTVEFCGRVFACDGRALIPRPETEQLVEIATEEARKLAPPLRVLDVGAGSGIIGLSLAAELGEIAASVTLVDVSAEALALALNNSESLGLDPTSLGFVESDLFENLHGEFDVIAANLPYIASAEIETLSEEVKHDPTLALDGGSLGTELMERFIQGLPEVLAVPGFVVMEIGAGQEDELLDSLKGIGLVGCKCVEDFAGIGRYLLAWRKN
jgi:release factor glutamine methyltransferase